MIRRHRQRLLADPRRADGHTADGLPGDCLRTALACLLEVRDLDSVPHFGLYTHPCWWTAVRRWVRAGRHPYGEGWDIAYTDDPPWPAYLDPDDAPACVITGGPSPRGPWLHVVVADARTGALVHDPHPSGAGLLAVEEAFVLVRLYDDPPPDPYRMLAAGAPSSDDSFTRRPAPPDGSPVEGRAG